MGLYGSVSHPEALTGAGWWDWMGRLRAAVQSHPDEGTNYLRKLEKVQLRGLTTHITV